MLARQAATLIGSAVLGLAVVGGWGCGVASAESTDSDSSSPAADPSTTEPSAEPSDPASDSTVGAKDEVTDDEVTDHVVRPGDDDVEVDLTPPDDDDVELRKTSSRNTDIAESSVITASLATVTETEEAALQPSSAVDDTPDAPTESPESWALLAFARREVGAAAADWENQYTGEPTIVHQLVVTGLRVVDAALRPFGGLLEFTSLRVPLFTDGVPPFFFRHGLKVTRDEFDGMPVWTLRPNNPSEQHVVALHGGAYVATASLFHWWTYTDMARDTGATVMVPLYPLVPDGGTAAVSVPKTADFIDQLIAEHGAENVSVIGDSAGGGLALAAVQELVHRGTPVPSRMVLFAPWLDVTVSDPLSVRLDPGDPLLDVPNLRQAGQDWGGELGAEHPYASPLYGSLEGLPPTAVYSGSLDLLTPDALRLRQRVLEEGYDNFTFDLRSGLLHDWAIFGFLPDARSVRPSVYDNLIPRTTPATFTGQPTVLTRLGVTLLSVVTPFTKAIGLDFSTIASFAASDRPPLLTTLGLAVSRDEFDGMPVSMRNPAIADVGDPILNPQVLRDGQVHDWALPLLPDGLAQRRTILRILTGDDGAPLAGLLPLL
ncbi:alpha/beta hydrolase fold domain-containing protein [Mycolicibacterium sp. XJ1819]